MQVPISYEDQKMRDDIAYAHDTLMATKPKTFFKWLDKWAGLLLLAFIDNRRMKNRHAQINAFRRAAGMEPQSYATTMLMEDLATNRGEDYERLYGNGNPMEYQEFDSSHEDERIAREQEAVLQSLRDEKELALKMYYEEQEELNKGK